MPKVSADKAQNSAHRSEQESTNRRKYFFKDVDDLATYLCKLNPIITPIKLQKGLYFLYAYYLGIFSNFNANDEFTGTSEVDDKNFYPEELFAADFVAWKLGPVILSVVQKHKDGVYMQAVKSLDVGEVFELDTSLGLELKLWVDDFFLNRVCQMNDFALVDRSRVDRAYSLAWRDGSKPAQVMDSKQIKDEYLKIQKSTGTMYG